MGSTEENEAKDAQRCVGEYQDSFGLRFDGIVWAALCLASHIYDQLCFSRRSWRHLAREASTPLYVFVATYALNSCVKENCTAFSHSIT